MDQEQHSGVKISRLLENRVDRELGRSAVFKRLFGRQPPTISIGNYVLQRKIGEGGFGSIYLAYDPILDRKLAIKLLRKSIHKKIDPKSLDLLREGKAMASISHPNVASIYEIGVDREDLFIAIEYIEGVTLREWCRHKNSSRVLSAYLQAGRGLEAIHASGLIHRDFKPENVLVGRGGIAKVVDFGFAISAKGARPCEANGADPRDGTEGYLAPEQLSGQEADHLSDQYAFAMSLLHALGGKKAGDTTLIPFIDGILARALSSRPSERWPSMAKLLAEIERAIATRKKRRSKIFQIAFGLSVSAGFLLYQQQSDERLCTPDNRASVVWNPKVQETLRERILAGGREHAKVSFPRLSDDIDTWVRDWKSFYAELCERVPGGQVDKVEVTKRRACFSRQLDALDIFLEILRESEPAAIDHALVYAAQLPEPKLCMSNQPLDYGAVVEPSLHKSSLRALWKAEKAYHLGSLDDAKEQIDGLVLQLSKTENIPPRMELWLTHLHADVLITRDNDGRGAREQLWRALELSTQLGNKEVQAILMATLAFVTSVVLGEHVAGEGLVHASLALFPSGSFSPAIEADRSVFFGRVFQASGNYSKAEAFYERALYMRRSAFGDTHYSIGISLGLRGEVKLAQGNESGIHDLRTAQEIMIRQLGSGHPALNPIEARIDNYEQAHRQ